MALSPYTKPPVIAAPDFVDIEPGAPLVAEPPNHRQCWGLVRKPDMRRPYRCPAYARGGVKGGELCTCWKHRRLDRAAQALREALRKAGEP